MAARPTRLLAGPAGHAPRRRTAAALAGWHQAFDPINRFGLVLINTHGGPTELQPRGRPGPDRRHPRERPGGRADDPQLLGRVARRPRDDRRALARQRGVRLLRLDERAVPPGVPSARPGRVVPGGEPSRRHRRAADSRGELYGQPWRLVYFGDPLYRVRPSTRTPGADRLVERRSRTGRHTSSSASRGRTRPSQPGSTWVLQTAIFRFQTAATPQPAHRPAGDASGNRPRPPRPAAPPALRRPPGRHPAPGRTAGRTCSTAWRRVPPGERSPSLRRHLETAQMAALQRRRPRKDLREAHRPLGRRDREPGSRDFAATFTARVGRLADTPTRLNDWRNRLRSVLRSAVESPNKSVVEDELKRVEALSTRARANSVRECPERSFVMAWLSSAPLSAAPAARSCG